MLLHGAPGTGKSKAAEALGYEVGKPLKASLLPTLCVFTPALTPPVQHTHTHTRIRTYNAHVCTYTHNTARAHDPQVVNCAELLSKWVGESTKNIDAIFEEARHSDAILVFDEAEGLFGSRTEMR